MVAVRTSYEKHANAVYFTTFTCFDWLPLFDLTDTYDSVYKWFDRLRELDIRVAGYVIMPNHLHLLLCFADARQSLNAVISNGKRFLAYEIIKRLESAGREEVLLYLEEAVTRREKRKGQKHKVFNESFDAKECVSKAFCYQKLDYIHFNPVRNKWNLAQDYTRYRHSSAGFYEYHSSIYQGLIHINEVIC